MSKHWKRLKLTLTKRIDVEELAINLGFLTGRIVAELVWLIFKLISNIVVPVLLVIENVLVGFGETLDRKRSGMRDVRRSQKSLQIKKY
jgi:hypothetical protein